jgi:hypothetical protein
MEVGRQKSVWPPAFLSRNRDLRDLVEMSRVVNESAVENVKQVPHNRLLARGSVSGVESATDLARPPGSGLLLIR